jgi:hypothetical protein
MGKAAVEMREAAGGYTTLADLLVFCVCALMFFVGVALLSDLIRILSGTYKDGNGHRITKWT